MSTPFSSAFSVVQLIKTTVAWTGFAVGATLNLFLLFLIRKRTPTAMKRYSIVLLQTCFTDLCLVLVYGFIDVSLVVDDDGANEMFLSGPFIARDVAHRWVNFSLLVLWVFLVYVSLFGFVAQFIYRFLLINKDKQFSNRQYLSMLGGIIVVPLVYCGCFGYAYYPPEAHSVLQSSQAKSIMGLTNDSEQIVLAGYNNGGTVITVAFYYILVACTGAYALILLLGWRTARFVRRNLKGGTNNQQKIMEVHHQITKTLLLQATLPAFIYLSLLFLLVSLLARFQFSPEGMYALNLYCIFSTATMTLPAAFNPAVAILTIRAYRAVPLSILRTFTLKLRKILCCFSKHQQQNNVPTNNNIGSNNKNFFTNKKIGNSSMMPVSAGHLNVVMVGGVSAGGGNK